MKPEIINHPKAYLIMAAVRGPDLHCSSFVPSPIYYVLHELKWKLTARIRFIVFEPRECLGDYNFIPLSEKELGIIEQHLRIISGTPGTRHFVHHLADAVLATQNHAIWGGHGYQLHKLLSAYW